MNPASPCAASRPQAPGRTRSSDFGDYAAPATDRRTNQGEGACNQRGACNQPMDGSAEQQHSDTILVFEALIPNLVQNTGGDAGLAIYQLLSRSGDGQPGLELGNEVAGLSPQPCWDRLVPSSVFTFNCNPGVRLSRG